jgi:hypothetical protein
MARHARYNYSSATRAALQLSWSAGGVRFWHMHRAGKLANMGGNRTVGCAALLLLLACGRETAAKHADDIPRANTGGNPPYVCGQPTMPPPVLAECTDVIAPGLPDLRGNWSSPDPAKPHWERIEQCVDRATIAGPEQGLYYVHDFPHANNSLATGCHDYAAPDFPHCVKVSVAGLFNSTCLLMKPFGLSVAVTRCLLPDGSMELDWGGNKMRLVRQ